ncbi:MAG TPA: hypothetical protein VG325_12540 [Solirubrobacteraceae bacterium]|nr:hypothetical protein [Solirubrobacteraceae bacterium]
MRRLLTAVAVAAVSSCAGGCALTPGAGGSSSAASIRPSASSRLSAPSGAARTGALVAQANRTHEYPTPAPRQTVIGGWRTPVQAVEVFTATYINWTASTVTDRLRALAEVSVGQARSAMSLAAAETAKDYELRRGGVANSGTVEAIALLRSGANQYAVVTRETTTATNSSAYRGLAPAWHVTLATVTRVAGGLWVLTDWQPEN